MVPVARTVCACLLLSLAVVLAGAQVQCPADRTDVCESSYSLTQQINTLNVPTRQSYCFVCDSGQTNDVTWRIAHNEVALSHGEIRPDGTLIIFDTECTFDTQSAVQITCDPSGPVSSKTLLVFLTIFKPPRLPDSYRVNISQSLTLECDTSESTRTFIDDVYWIDPRGRITDAKNLYIPSVNSSDAGEYTCVVKSKDGTRLSASTTVIVQLLDVEHPADPTDVCDSSYSLMKRIAVLNVASGQSYCFICDTGQTSNVTWRIAHNEVASSDGEIMSDGTLVIFATENTFSTRSSVQITCDPSGPESSKTLLVFLTIFKPPQLPLCYKVNITQNLTLECDTSESTQTFIDDVYWINPSGTITDARSLYIPSVNSSDAGEYTCVVKSKDGARLNASTTVIVQLMDGAEAECPADTTDVCITSYNLTEQVAALNVESGQSYCFVCDTGQTNDVTWRIAHNEVALSDGEIMSDGILVIFATENTFSTHSAVQITCDPSGSESSKTLLVFLTIFKPPRLPDFYRAIISHSLTLECDTSESTQTFIDDVYWIDPSGTITDAKNLYIPSVNSSDAGEYTCVVKSKDGARLSASTTVIVQFPPDMPTGLAIIDVTNSSISLTWEIGGGGSSPITGVDIEYESLSLGVIHEGSKSLGGQPTSYTITDLQPFTNYSIQVFVFNDIERSVPGSIVEKTLSYSLEAPRVVELIPLSSVELQLSWMPPVINNLTTDSVSMWIIEFQIADESLPVEVRTINDPATLTATFSGLKVGTSYTARVAGVNGVGQGAFSDATVEQTLVDLTEICNLDVDPGSCLSEEKAFFFNRETGECERFTYSGCGGNPNRFSTIRECRDTCNLCLLPPETGLCKAFVPSFFFNSTSKKCERFIYGGCQGNANRFPSIMDCQGMCGGGDCPPTCSKLFCNHNRGAICSNPGPQQPPGCTSSCQLTCCNACYYSEETLPTPDVDQDLPQRCQGITDYTNNESCLRRWASEVRKAHRNEHGQPLVKDPELFKCYSPDCSDRG